MSVRSIDALINWQAQLTCNFVVLLLILGSGGSQGLAHMFHEILREKITKLKISTRMEGGLRLRLVGLGLLGTALFENVQVSPSGRFSLPHLESIVSWGPSTTCNKRVSVL